MRFHDSLFFLFVVSIQFESGHPDNSLFVADRHYIHQFSMDDPNNCTKTRHPLAYWTIEFLTVRSFEEKSTEFIAVFGGCFSTSVGYMKKQSGSKPFASKLKLFSIIGHDSVCYGLPGFQRELFYAMLDSGKIVQFNSTDRSVKKLLDQRSSCFFQSTLQIDYYKRLLYYTECSADQKLFLKQVNLTDNYVKTKLFMETIEKFQIDFNTNEIFAISSKVLLKGNLEESKWEINLNRFKNFPTYILDLAITPSCVCIILDGEDTVIMITRSDGTQISLNANFIKPQALAYLHETEYPSSTTEYPSSTTEYSSSTTEYSSSTTEYSSSTAEYPSSTTEYPFSTTDYTSSTTEYPSSTTEYSSSTTEYPSSTTEYPSSTTEYSSSTTEYPSSTTEYPSSTTEYSSSTTEYSSSTTEYPLSTTEYPSSTTEYPSSTTEYPSSTTEYPSSTTEYFSSSTVYPSSTTEYLSSTTEYPSSTTEYPSSTTEYSSSTTEYSSSTTEYPSSTTEYPSTTTDYSSSTTEYPSSTTEYSSSTTDYSSSTTEYPSSTTEYSSSTTEYPSSATEYPSSTTEYPSSTTEYSSSTTEYPSSTTEYSSSTTEYPSSTTEYPSSTTEYPSSTTEYPSSTTEYPSSTTEYSSSSTEYSPSTTEYPSSTTEYSSSTTDYSSSTTEYPSSTTEYLTSTTEYPTSTFEYPISTILPNSSSSQISSDLPHVSNIENTSQVPFWTTSAFLGDKFNDILLIVDRNYIHRLPANAGYSSKNLHNMSNQSFEFLTAKRFQDSLLAFFGGCLLSSMGYLVQKDDTEITELPVNLDSHVCHAVSGFDNHTFFALLETNDIIHYDMNTHSFQSVAELSCESNCHSRCNIQIDYELRILYYLECSQENIQFLKQKNLIGGSDTGLQLSTTIQKFEIDFKNLEIFAISSNNLLKGKLNSVKVNFEVFKSMSGNILDLGVSPKNIYIIIAGDNNVKMVSRSGGDLFNVQTTFDNPQALAYLHAFSGETTIKPPGIGTSTTPDNGLNAAICFSDIDTKLLVFNFILVLTQW